MFIHSTQTRRASKFLIGMFAVLIFISPLLAPLRAYAVEASADRTAAGIQQTAKDAPQPKFGCFERQGGDVFPTLDGKSCFAAILWEITKTFGKLTTMAAGLLNFAMQRLVIGMGQMVKSLTAITEVWTVMRDLVNIMLVFLTLFMGIATIIGVSGYGYKQLLWRIILAAVLVNFSITLAKFVIDVGNVLTIEVYQQFLVEAKKSPSAVNAPDPDKCTNFATMMDSACMNYGVGGAFMNEMHIATVYTSKVLQDKGAGTGEFAAKIIWISIMAIAVFLISAFVFAAAAFLIIGRFIVLIILIMISPIALVSWITHIGGLGRKWWESLLSQSFFLPIMMLMWWMGLKVVINYNKIMVGAGSGITDAASQLIASPKIEDFTSGLNMFVFFAVTAAFIAGSLVAAKSMGARGAAMTINVGRNMSRAAGGLAFAGTVGVASSRVSNLYQRKMSSALAKDADGNFIEKGGLAQMKRKIAGTKLDRYAQAGLGAGANTGILGTKSLKDRRDQNKKDTLARRKELTEVGARESATKHAAVLATGSTATAEQKDAARRNIQALSTSALEDIATRNPKLFDNAGFAESLSAKQMEELQKSQNIDSRRVSEATAHRAAAHDKSLTPVPTPVPGGGTVLRPDTRAGRRVTKAMTESELRTLGTTMSARITRAPGTTPLTVTQVEHIVETLPGAQITNLSDKALVEPDVYAHLNAAQLTALNNADRLTDTERRTIRTAVLAGGGTASANNWFNNPTGPGATWI